MITRILRLTAVLAVLTVSAFTLAACEEPPSDADQSDTAPDAGMGNAAPSGDADNPY